MGRMLKGGCLCGAVSLKAKPEAEEIGACHCSICRKWSAGPFLSVGCGPNVEIRKGSPIGVYRSSMWAERVFCKECGSNLLWRTLDGSHNHISAEVFNPDQDFPLASQIFIDEKPTGYEFANRTRNMTGAEVFAMFAPDGDKKNAEKSDG